MRFGKRGVRRFAPAALRLAHPWRRTQKRPDLLQDRGNKGDRYEIIHISLNLEQKRILDG